MTTVWNGGRGGCCVRGASVTAATTYNSMQQQQAERKKNEQKHQRNMQISDLIKIRRSEVLQWNLLVLLRTL